MAYMHGCMHWSTLDIMWLCYRGIIIGQYNLRVFEFLDSDYYFRARRTVFANNMQRVM